MESISYPKKEPFDAVTGDLRPDYRDAYLQDQLTPEPAQQIEAYLSKNVIKKRMALGRYHELSATATAAGRTLVPPLWVQVQLQRQASFSAAGPWRRPVVRLAGGMLLVLIIASGVQWMRNEPLVPAPVAAAVVRVAASASQATRKLVQHFTAPATAQAETVVPTQPKTKSKIAPQPRQRPAAVPEPEPTPALAGPVAEATPAPADSAKLAMPASLASSSPASVAKKTPLMQTVQGRISDAEGRPLSGATVLVPGTQLITTTNVTGDYTLSVPAGTQLKFGYAGFTDEVLPTNSTATSSTQNVVLTPEVAPTKRSRRQR